MSSRIAVCISVRSSTEWSFRYAQMWGCSVDVFSSPAESCFATIPEIYASMVSISDMGLLSFIDCSFGIGILVVCFALSRSSL